MSSTAFVSDPGPLDLGHLERMTCGEKALAREVLEMFLQQTSRLIKALGDQSADAATLSHTLKGSARAIGAFRVAEAAATLEEAARSGGDTSKPIAELRAAVVEARGAIEALLRRA